MALTLTLRAARRAFEQAYVRSVLVQHGWSVPAAARTLGMARENLYRKMRALQIRCQPRTSPDADVQHRPSVRW